VLGGCGASPVITGTHAGSVAAGVVIGAAGTSVEAGSPVASGVALEGVPTQFAGAIGSADVSLGTASAAAMAAAGTALRTTRRMSGR
jgi:hypothetical protein